MIVDALLVAVLICMMVRGGYTQWTISSLQTPCENMLEVQLICPGRCEDCPRCVTEFLGECQCVPMSFLEEYPNPDPVHSCWYFWLYDWTQPKCCEAVKDQMKRNGIPLGSSWSANQNIGLHSNIADTNKRANGELNDTTNASEGEINTSGTGEDDAPMNENNNNVDSIVDDPTNVDITEKVSGNGGSNTNNELGNGDDKSDAETQNDNRTRSVKDKTDNYDDKDDESMSSDSARNRRDSLLMRALILTQELLKTEDMRKDVRGRDRFK